MSSQSASVSMSRRAAQDALVLFIFFLFGIIMIIASFAFRSHIGEIPTLIVTNIGAVLLTLSISQFHFVRYALPDMIERTIIISRGLDNPANLIQYLSSKRDDQRLALGCLLRAFFGRKAKPQQALVDHLTNFMDRYATHGFCRKDYKTTIHLEPIETDHYLGSRQEVREQYYQARFTTEYEVLNVSGETKSYRARFRLQNHDYAGVDRPKSIIIHKFSIDKTKVSTGVLLEHVDILSKIRKDYPEKLTPLLSTHATVQIDLVKAENSKKQSLLERITTTKIGKDEKLRITEEYVQYLKKQDFHLANMSYFTQGFTVELIVPGEVSASFSGRFSGQHETIPARTISGFTTYEWTTDGFVHPNEGGIVWWTTRRSVNGTAPVE